jgi:hypothetical protein
VPAWLVVLVIALAVASRPIEVRLWRAGRLSDRALALLVLSRFPIISVIFAIMLGGSLPFIAFIAAISLLPGLFLYRFALAFIQNQATERRPN